MAAPTRVQSTTSTQPSLTSPTNTYVFPADCAAGNLIVVCLAGDKNTGTLSVSDNVSGSTGWTIETAITGASVSLYIARKVAVGGERTITATTSADSTTGNSGYAEEMTQAGTGAWMVVAKATPTYSDTSRSSAASGTTDTADYEGRALAVGVVDSLSSLTSDTGPTFTNFSRINVPARPSGSGGGNAGCYVGEANMAQGATTSTTFATNGGSDQLTAAIAAFGRVATAPPTAKSATDAGTGSDAISVQVSTITTRSATDAGTGTDTASVVTLAAPPKPGQLFDLSRWHLTLPTEDPGPDTDAAQIDQPELATYEDSNYYVESGEIVCVAPVQGFTTSGQSGATRTEHREHEAGSYANSAWNPLTTGRRQLTITTKADATGISGGSAPRKEAIIYQIHGAGDSPIPLILAAEYHVATPRIRVFLNGPGFANPVLGITPTTPITIRCRVENAAMKLWVVAGQVADLPVAPTYEWDIASTFSDLTGWYFKWGIYNKTTIASGSTGASSARISFIEHLQPGDPDPVTGPEPGRMLLALP